MEVITMRRAMGVVLLRYVFGVATILGLAGNAIAVCEWIAPAELVVLPSDGSASIPLDARIWVLGGWGSQVSVSAQDVALEGEQEGRGWWSFVPEGIEANSTYEFTVTVCRSLGCPTLFEYGPFSFSVSAEKAETPAQVLVASVFSGAPGSTELEDVVSESCQAQLLQQDCFDELPLAIVAFDCELSSGAVVRSAWIGQHKPSKMLLSTIECPILMAGHTADLVGNCIWLMNHNIAGESSEPVQVCADQPLRKPDGSITEVEDLLAAEMMMRGLKVEQVPEPCLDGECQTSPAVPDTDRSGEGQGCRTSALSSGSAVPEARGLLLFLAFLLVFAVRYVLVLGTGRSHLLRK